MSAGEAAPSLDPVIHAPARLRIMAALATLEHGDRVTFPRLQKMLDLTGGNLTTHLRKLEEAGYAVSTRKGQGRTATTSIALTEKGRNALASYRQALTDILG